MTFSVKDESFIYDFVFERAGPYQTADEAFLTKYWQCIEKGTGWTFKVIDSNWKNTFGSFLENIYFTEGLDHYVIATVDLCLEILAEKAPEIKKTAINLQ
jgi:hypothetical protein